jgi:hypothetical protein
MRKIQEEENDWSRDQEVLRAYKEGLETEIADLKEQIASMRKPARQGADTGVAGEIQRARSFRRRQGRAGRHRPQAGGKPCGETATFPAPLLAEAKVAQGVEDLKRDLALPPEKRNEGVSKRLLKCDQSHRRGGEIPADRPPPRGTPQERRRPRVQHEGASISASPAPTPSMKDGDFRACRTPHRRGLEVRGTPGTRLGNPANSSPPPRAIRTPHSSIFPFSNHELPAKPQPPRSPPSSFPPRPRPGPARPGPRRSQQGRHRTHQHPARIRGSPPRALPRYQPPRRRGAHALQGAARARTRGGTAHRHNQTLEREIEARKTDFNYSSGILNQYSKALVTRLHPAENQLHKEASTRLDQRAASLRGRSQGGAHRTRQGARTRHRTPRRSPAARFSKARPCATAASRSKAPSGCGALGVLRREGRRFRRRGHLRGNRHLAAHRRRHQGSGSGIIAGP